MKPEKAIRSYRHISSQRLLVQLNQSISLSSMPWQGATQHPPSLGMEKEQPGQFGRTFQMLLAHFWSWQGPPLIIISEENLCTIERFIILIYDRTSRLSKVGVNLLGFFLRTCDRVMFAFIYTYYLVFVSGQWCPKVVIHKEMERVGRTPIHPGRSGTTREARRVSRRIRAGASNGP